MERTILLGTIVLILAPFYVMALSAAWQMGKVYAMRLLFSVPKKP